MVNRVGYRNSSATDTDYNYLNKNLDCTPVAAESEVLDMNMLTSEPATPEILDFGLVPLVFQNTTDRLEDIPHH